MKLHIVLPGIQLVNLSGIFYVEFQMRMNQGDLEFLCQTTVTVYLFSSDHEYSKDYFTGAETSVGRVHKRQRITIVEANNLLISLSPNTETRFVKSWGVKGSY